MNLYNTKEVVDEIYYIEKNIRPLSPEPTKRILITGSTAGIGFLTAKTLIMKGYKVVVHARNEERAKDARRDLPEAEAVVTGDLSDLKEVKKLAGDINALGTFDVIIHNAGVYDARSSGNAILNVNALAPYILTSLLKKPRQLIYLCSDLHLGGNLKLQSMQDKSSDINYSDSKLQVLVMSKAVSRKWRDVKVNAVNPGWVATKMGKSGAPDDLRLSYGTLVWLAEGTEEGSNVTGQLLFQKKIEKNYNLAANDPATQDALLETYAKVTGVSFPN
ncbi:SDR family NAD(P)-dependent oxidoreductase [Chryseobacterium sp. JJR-5R]|uniref:SDR family NAD(P)-dependent oxidoreductase n=1 Tax=Chryseobacterium sp. JJR-5R TaxID=3093923 RepID=UPI002A753C79|nr:SDR family NAD(P)-dependent oxidoreductase [Chryseobacterium sp. JJR-5R]WPO84342.1 SDR family NAD(P)-dependent oxidoreductase [Chryseobacterium sp. JJR-5R]